MVVVCLKHVPAAVRRVQAPHIVRSRHVAGDDAAFSRGGAADGEVHLRDQGVVGQRVLGVGKRRRVAQSVPDELRVDLRALHRDGLHQLLPQLLQRLVLSIGREPGVYSHSPARRPQSREAAYETGVRHAAVLRHTRALEVNFKRQVAQDVGEAHALSKVEVARVKNAAVGGLSYDAGAESRDFVTQVGDCDDAQAGVQSLSNALHFILCITHEERGGERQRKSVTIWRMRYLVGLAEEAGDERAERVEFGRGCGEKLVEHAEYFIECGDERLQGLYPALLGREVQVHDA